jgi:prepilin-type N-terminal cleavage/methylation domain-containing protein
MKPLSAAWIRRGFTLIELLVVVSLIGLLVAGVNFLRPAGGGIALQAAQARLISLLAASRMQAVSNQVPVRLLVWASPPPEGDREQYLRYLRIVRPDPADEGEWIALDEPVYLPRGVYFVPPTVPVTHLGPGVNWPAGPHAAVSTVLGPAAIALNGRSIPAAYYLEYGPDGQVDRRVTKLVLATARPSPDSLPRFDNPAAVRGVRLGPAGSMFPVENPAGF